MKKEKIKMNVDDFKECHFCHLKIIPLDFGYEWNLETLGDIRELLGTIPEREAGDLESLLNFEYRKD